MEWHLRLALPCHGTRASRAMSSISTPFSRMLQFTGRGGRQVDSRVRLQIAPLQGSNRIGNVEGGRAALRGTQTTRAHAIRRCGRLPGSAGREQTTRAISASSCQNPTVLRSRPHPIDHLDLFLITISGLFLFLQKHISIHRPILSRHAFPWATSCGPSIFRPPSSRSARFPATWAAPPSLAAFAS